jgi:hypothetical protein
MRGYSTDCISGLQPGNNFGLKGGLDLKTAALKKNHHRIGDGLFLIFCWWRKREKIR